MCYEIGCFKQLAEERAVNKHFIPVKILQKEYADKLVQGEVFMRALYEFGSWGKLDISNEELKNDYRGDLYSGVTATFKSPEDIRIFAGLPLDMKKNMMNCCMIDESDIKYFKIFSLYRYELNEETQAFIRPDARMSQFGDTAVLITDFYEFIERFEKAWRKAYEKATRMIGIVEPFNFYETRYLNPLFCKHESQAYQNELRIALGELTKAEGDSTTENQDKYALLYNLDPVKLKIGDLSDITVELPIEDFMRGYLPPDFKCRWPSNDDPNHMSNYDVIVESTKEQMEQYHSDLVRPTCTIVPSSN